MATLTYQELPANCIIICQQGWMFTAHVLNKGKVVAHCLYELWGLTCFINDWQLRQAGPVFLKLGISQRFEPLSYEQVVALYRAELTPTPQY